MPFWRRKKKEPESLSTTGEVPLLDDLIRAHKMARENREWGPILERDEWTPIAEAAPGDQIEVILEVTRRVDDEKIDYDTRAAYRDVMDRLLRRALPYQESDLLQLIAFCCVQTWGRPASQVLRAIQRHVKDRELSDELRAGLESLRPALESNDYVRGREFAKLTATIGEILGEAEVDTFPLYDGQPFAARLLEDLESFAENDTTALRHVLAHAATAEGSKPTKKWAKEAAARVSAVDERLFRAAVTAWLDAYDVPLDEVPTTHPRTIWATHDANVNLVKGMIWCAAPANPDADLIRAMGRVGLSGQRKIPSLGPRATRITNAAAWALGAIDDPLALAQLAILRSRIKNRAVQKQMEKALFHAAERLGVSREEVDEMAVPTFGLTDVGRLEEKMGAFTAELEVIDSSSVVITWRKEDGKTQKSVPKAVKDEHADDLKELKAAAKDIQKFLPTQRERLDALYCSMKTWPLDVWRERYLDHPIVGVIARRLIWNINAGDRTTSVIFAADSFGDANGTPFHPPEDATVSLWHPIDVPMDDVLTWRARLAELTITQPFKQAHREIYVLTDAERSTRVYSNRYAAHILKQHQFHALCGARGWHDSLRLMVDDDFPPATRPLPAHGLRAEYWVDGVGDEYGRDTNDAGTFHYLATDQVRFYPLDAEQLQCHAGGGSYAPAYGSESTPDPVPVEEIPALVFSEVMRDVDLFVGVASVGNDPAWMDRGEEIHQDYWRSYAFGELSTSAVTRREVLEGLIPRLKIADRCSFEDKFLVVRGNIRTYNIHLGSGNILMDPDARYLCIVPKAASITSATKKVFLPFEGDRTLSLVLSKALLLAADDKITDPTIVSQIKER